MNEITSPEIENMTMDQKIHPVLRIGKCPYITARKPAAVITITPGMVKYLSAVMMPFIVKLMIFRSRVFTANFIQKSPAAIFPRNTITATRWISLR